LALMAIDYARINFTWVPTWSLTVGQETGKLFCCWIL
jgi:hypothetical protein